MYRIKQFPEDFIVKEISSINPQPNGQYAYFLLKKTNYTTVDALQILSGKFRIPLKNFGFAGNKDKNAVTEQKISVFRGSRNFENIELNGIELEYLGNGKTQVSLGDLEGNEFTIMIRNLDENTVKKIKKLENKKIKIPNLYGPQRFSRNNGLIGKAIVKRDFRKAAELVLEGSGNAEAQIRKYLENNKNNYIEALRLIPVKTRKLFVHSYQSFLFNRTAEEYLKNNKKAKNAKIPIVGFNLEIDEVKNKKLRNIIKKIVGKEKINSRDFVISQMPELTSEGGFRNLFFELNFAMLETNNDELNKNGKKTKVSFALPKSCYATVALEFLLR